jgi:hypothetical protein
MSLSVKSEEHVGFHNFRKSLDVGGKRNIDEVN